MKKLTFFAIAALSLISVSCSKSQSPEGPRSGEKFIMILNADVFESAAAAERTKATIGDDWKFAFTEGDHISLTNDRTEDYYTLERDDKGNFTGEVTAPEADAYWYAYYPSSSVSLTGQAGTKDGAAAYYALAGKTTEQIPAHSTNLKITLHPQTAILVIDNKKGAGIDINVKTSDGKYVSGLTATAKVETAAFSVTKIDTKVSLFSTTETGAGPYYVVVPAGVQMDIYDGDAKIKSTKEAGLTAGKYYNITVGKPVPAGALPGVFSVSETKKVHFSKGNLYYNGSKFDFEANQYEYHGYNSANNTWGLFGWVGASSTAFTSSPEIYGVSTSITNKDYGNGATDALKADWGTAIDDKGTWSTLSTAEWQYLFNTRKMANSGAGYENLTKDGITVESVIFKGVVLFPDDFTDQADWKTKYTTWKALNDAGLVFLPAAGYRNSSSVNSVGDLGYYWSSSAAAAPDEGDAYSVGFKSGSVTSASHVRRGRGLSVRLITEVK